MKERELDEVTSIQLKRGFLEWLKCQGVKGDSYQDILLKIIRDLPPEILKNYFLRSCFNYEETAKLLGIRLPKKNL